MKNDDVMDKHDFLKKYNIAENWIVSLSFVQSIPVTECIVDARVLIEFS